MVGRRCARCMQLASRSRPSSTARQATNVAEHEIARDCGAPVYNGVVTAVDGGRRGIAQPRCRAAMAAARSCSRPIASQFPGAGTPNVGTSLPSGRQTPLGREPSRHFVPIMHKAAGIGRCGAAAGAFTLADCLTAGALARCDGGRSRRWQAIACCDRCRRRAPSEAVGHADLARSGPRPRPSSISRTT